MYADVGSAFFKKKFSLGPGCITCKQASKRWDDCVTQSDDDVHQRCDLRVICMTKQPFPLSLCLSLPPERIGVNVSILPLSPPSLQLLSLLIVRTKQRCYYCACPSPPLLSIHCVSHTRAMVDNCHNSSSSDVELTVSSPLDGVRYQM